MKHKYYVYCYLKLLNGHGHTEMSFCVKSPGSKTIAECTKKSDATKIVKALNAMYRNDQSGTAGE